MKICVDYVFEYFNNYLNITEAEEKTVLHNEKLEKYRKQLREYEPEVRDWAVGIYSEYGKQIHKYVGKIIKENEFFFLYNADSEFRNASYDCYSQLHKRLPCFLQVLFPESCKIFFHSIATGISTMLQTVFC
jgi:hypothetical protein